MTWTIFFRDLALVLYALCFVTIIIIISKLLKGERGDSPFVGETQDAVIKKNMYLTMCIIYCVVIVAEVAVVINKMLLGTPVLVLSNHRWVVTFESIILFVSEAGNTFVLLIWMFFVDYTLNKSLDHIRRHRLVYIVAFIIYMLIFAAFLYVYIFVYSESDQAKSSFASIFVLYVAPILLNLFNLYIVVHTYRMVAKYERERRPPILMRHDVFVIPVLIGSVISDLIPLTDAFAVTGFTLGLVLAWRILTRRSKYLDPDTGFFNQEYLLVMNKYFEKKGFLKGIGVLFSAPGRTDDLAEAVEQMHSDNSELFLLSDGVVLLTSGEQENESIDLLIRLVGAAAERNSSPFKVETRTLSRQDGEDAAAFTSRILEESKSFAGSSPRG